MKSICSILILMIALHSQCGVQCLGTELNIPSHQAASTPEQPPCHQHAENPQKLPFDQDSSRNNHDNSNPCGQAQSIESRIGPISKCSLDCVAMEPVASPVSLDQGAIRVHTIIVVNGPAASLSPTQPAVLRI
jgi:hypothetical protein